MRVAGAASSGRRSRTPGGCGTRSARRCPSACRRRSPSRSATRWATSSARYARTHGPFTAADAAARFGLGRGGRRDDALRRLEAAGRLVEGELRPGGDGAASAATPSVLRTLRRRSLAALRAEVEPVPPAALARVPARWQGVGHGGALRGVDGRAAGASSSWRGPSVPASALETLVLPARVADYSPAMLDELTAAGEVVWAGHGALPGEDGWVSLHPADTAPTSPLPDAGSRRSVDAELHRAVLDALAGGGAYFFRGAVRRGPAVCIRTTRR